MQFHNNLIEKVFDFISLDLSLEKAFAQIILVSVVINAINRRDNEEIGTLVNVIGECIFLRIPQELCVLLEALVVLFSSGHGCDDSIAVVLLGFYLTQDFFTQASAQRNAVLVELYFPASLHFSFDDFLQNFLHDERVEWI